MEDQITMVITSSNRFELLKKTLYSFLYFNKYPISKFIIIDDSEDELCHEAITLEFGAIAQVICNPVRIGQVASIDKAYSLVQTPWIFHCEDDWQFYRAGFVENSLKIMKADEKILQVWLREMNDTNGHPVSFEIQRIGDIPCSYLSFNFKGYYGFSFNPGLKRLSDYKLIGSYSSVPYDPASHPSKTARFYCPEMEISKFYADHGFRAVITPFGYVKHIGAGARVGWD